MVGYYLGGTYLIFKSANVRSSYKARERIELELMRRNSYQSKNCID